MTWLPWRRNSFVAKSRSIKDHREMFYNIRSNGACLIADDVPPIVLTPLNGCGCTFCIAEA